MLAKAFLSKTEENRRRNSPFVPSKSSEVKNLEKESNHGFSEFKSIQALNNYYHKDPNEQFSDEFEPPMFGNKKPSAKDRAISRGDL